VCLLLLAGLAGTLAQAAPVNVNVFGVKVGELDVTNYADTSAGGSASMTINANFTTTNQAAGGQANLNTVAPQGLTYMQTVLFTTNTQQTIFRTAGGANLVGTFADPPFLGYTLPGGGTAFTTDTRPWYSTITPAGTPGAIPPNFFAGPNQFSDTPTIPFADFGDGTRGLANVLNGQNGSLSFETALVGVCGQPNDNGVLNNTNPAFTGNYQVCVLRDFTWGLNFTYVGPAGGRAAGAYLAADYTTAAQALAFGTDVSAAFRGAFDKVGNNAQVEWNVTLIQADNCPEPGTYLLLSGGLVLVYVGRRKMARHAA
jgi:hypothetical protein